MKAVLFFTLFFSFSLFAKEPAIKITVPITASSFQIKGKKVYGSVKKSGDTLTGKEIYVKVKHLKSGMDLRDEHMKNSDRLDAKKYKKIYVRDIKGNNGSGTASIEVKGKKKKIKFKYDIDGKVMVAKFNLKTKAFGLKKMSYLGVGVKEEDGLDIVARVPIK